jgi:hypothetical protein
MMLTIWFSLLVWVFGTVCISLPCNLFGIYVVSMFLIMRLHIEELSLKALMWSRTSFIETCRIRVEFNFSTMNLLAQKDY